MHVALYKYIFDIKITFKPKENVNLIIYDGFMILSFTSSFIKHSGYEYFIQLLERTENAFRIWYLYITQHLSVCY